MPQIYSLRVIKILDFKLDAETDKNRDIHHYYKIGWETPAAYVRLGTSRTAIPIALHAGSGHVYTKMLCAEEEKK